MSITIYYHEVPAYAEKPTWEADNCFTASPQVGQFMGSSPSSTTQELAGDYLFSSPLTLTATFGAQPSIKGISFGFAGTTYATRVKVTKYSGEVSSSQTFYPTSAAYAYYAFSLPTPYTKLKIEFLAANKPNAVVNTEYFMLGKVTTYTGQDLAAMPVVTQEVNPVGTELPFDTSELSLYLPDGAPRFEKWDKIAIKQNSTWICTHYVNSAERNGDQYDVKCSSVVGLLDELGYDGVFLDSGTVTTPNLLKSIVNNVPPSQAGNIAAGTGVAEFVVNSSFDDPEYWNVGEYRGALPPGTRREALHRAIQCRGATLISSPNGVLQMNPFTASTTPTEIPASAIMLAGKNLKRNTPYSALISATYTHKGGNEQTIWTGAIQGTQRVYFDAPCYIASVSTGATVTPSGYTFVYYADITTQSAQTVTITGYKVEPVETKTTQAYTTDAGALQNIIEISGNDFYLYDGLSLASFGALGEYYSPLRQNAELTVKVIANSINLTLGNCYTVTLPGEGTITGWLTKKITTLSNSNRYAEITIIGLWEDET